MDSPVLAAVRWLSSLLPPHVGGALKLASVFLARTIWNILSEDPIHGATDSGIRRGLPSASHADLKAKVAQEREYSVPTIQGVVVPVAAVAVSVAAVVVGLVAIVVVGLVVVTRSRSLD